MTEDGLGCKFSRRSMLVCTAAATGAAVTGIGFLGASAFEPDDPNRTWLRVRELVGRDDKASELARKLAGSRVEVRGWEFTGGRNARGFDLYDRPPVACGGCGVIHGPGITLRVTGAGRKAGNLKDSILTGRLEVSGDGDVELRLS